MNVTPFNLTNLYIFLIELGFSIFFLIVFCCIHYGVINATKWGTKLRKSRLFNFFYFFIFGFVLSLVTFIVSQISSVAFGAIGMPLTILGLIYAMTIFYNRSVQIGAIVPSIIWILYQFNGFYEYNIYWLSRVVIILIIAAIAIATTFIKWKKWPTFLLSCLITLIVILVILLSLMNENTVYYCVSVIITIAVTILYFAVINFLNNWLVHMSKIAKQGAYVDKHYLIPNVLTDYFRNFVKKNNLTQALVVTFDIPDDSDKSIILENIYNLFKNQTSLFFKSSYSTYGVILAGKKYNVVNLNKSYLGNVRKFRTENDDLKFLEQQVLSLNNIDTSVVAYVSIYGVHSCKLESLLKDNNYAHMHDDFIKNHNVIQLFNTNIRNQETIDYASYTTLQQKVKLNEINIELELIQLSKNKKQYVCPRYYWPKKLTCNINTIIDQVGPVVGDTLLRYLASQSLELYAKTDEYKNIPILIYYPINQLNSKNWVTNEFLKKIHLFGIDKSKIILSFNISHYDQLPNQIITNLLDFEENNIKYTLIDVANIHAIKKLKPYGVILNQKLTNKSQLNRLAKRYKLNIF